jgi:pimeloyl-ACP methyl ester carboxylesterase
MANILANDIRLYYEEIGSGAPVLCIHGTSSSALVWGDALAPLAEVGRVITYDRRGHTRSERPHPYEVTSVAEHAADAAALLEGLRAAPAVVIGRSYGGEIALELALQHPAMVAALVLLEPAVLGLSASAASFVEPLTRQVLQMSTQSPHAVAETFLRAVAGDAVWEAFPRPLKEMFAENGPAIAAEFRGGYWDVTLDSLKTVQVPALLVMSEESPQPFREVAEAITAAIPGAQSCLVPGGHLISPGIPQVVDFVTTALRGMPT